MTSGHRLCLYCEDSNHTTEDRLTQKRPTTWHYRLRAGDRVSHPHYGTGTLLHKRYLGGVTTAAVRWDVRPLHLDMAAGYHPGTACGCDLADLEVARGD